MAKIVTVEVTIDNLQDSKYFNQPIEVTRNGEKVNIIGKLLQKGDTYETDYDHAKYLEESKVAKVVKDSKYKIDEY